MQPIEILSASEAFQKIRELNPSRRYWMMYSSLYNAFVKDPEAMVIPMDDHMVHRGDGIFEALRFHHGKIFELEAHLARLFKSAELISLKMPKNRQEIEDICHQMVRLAPEPNGMLRIFISRGHGDFSANPYSTVGSQIFLLSMPFKLMPPEKYERGASIIFSNVAVKPGFFANVKSCNYLPNVLTKKESVDRGADFAINITPDGFVAEGPTENIMILNSRNELIAPAFDYTLRGTTLLRTMDIARQHAAQLGLREVGVSDLKKADLLAAKEVMMVGTTLGVLPVTQIEGVGVGSSGTSVGQVGPVARALNAYLEHEMGMK
jgi:4-amino-4-deoxychorismate lyase